MSATIVWFRHDLRLADNPALSRAVERGGPVLPVFLWTPDEEGQWRPGAASQWYLHQSLQHLASDLDQIGSRLILRTGSSSRELLRQLVDATDADAIYWNARYLPAERERDREVAEDLEDRGVGIRRFGSYLLHNPHSVQTTSGGPYHVYTPFWRKVKDRIDPGPPLDVPDLDAAAPESWPDSDDLDSLDLMPDIDWYDEIAEYWSPGERAAQQQLERFIEEDLEGYDELRDRPDLDRTSRLSPRLHHGELSPRQVWHAVTEHAGAGRRSDAVTTYLKEIAWREFAYHLLWHYPEFPDENQKEKFDDFRWQDDEEGLERWKRGQTGYPIVDAGMRQLWAIGWMHNRVRMIVASFLCKDLLVHWREGARWFWDTLVDADLANNTMGWQWSAGPGPDAQPFFRIFNPVSQSERHDPEGTYIRRWIPELRDLPTKHLHAPWKAPREVLRDAGVTLGGSYPEPIVDHSDARDRALEEYNRIK